MVLVIQVSANSPRMHAQVVQMLLDKAARTELRNIDGDSALIEAARKGHAQVP